MRVPESGIALIRSLWRGTSRTAAVLLFYPYIIFPDTHFFNHSKIRVFPILLRDVLSICEHFVNCIVRLDF